ncbi:MAG: anhydro-N-acetylmuramic acid kinase [Pseudomonadota bacterium]
MSLVQRALGLMSGTSMDGIDIAAIETDGESFVRRLAQAHVPYEPAFRALLRQAVAEAGQLADRAGRPGCLADAEARLTELHAAVANKFIASHNWSAADFTIAGFHGHTLLHRPERQLTVQIGDGQYLADATGLTVVYDMRAADVAAGGQGAPLAPAYHVAMAGKIPERPVAVVNIGGVANVTWIGHGGALIAFDTGPGNSAIDDWMLRHTNVPQDGDGAMAATGDVNQMILDELLTHPYFAQLPPKSLDRNAFDYSAINELSLADGAATLTAFSAKSIGKAAFHFPQEPELWVICGGGRRNKTLMSMLAAAVENAAVPAEAIGFNGDMVEAEAWAYLAVRAGKRLPLSYPGTTGVGEPITGGRIATPKAR